MEQAHRSSGIRELDWLAPNTREVLRLACSEARQLHSLQVYPEHLLLGLLTLEKGPLEHLLQTSHLSIAQVRKHVQERCKGINSSVEEEELLFSEEAQDCLRRAVMALVADPPQPGQAKKVSPELLALSLFAHSRVQRMLASVATLAVLIHTRLVEQIGAASFQRMERSFLFARSPAQEERISLQYVTVGQQRRVLKSIEPPYYRLRDLAHYNRVQRDVRGLIELLQEGRERPIPSRGLLLVEPPEKRVKQLVRAIAGESETPLTVVFCAVLAEIWQERQSNEQSMTTLRELFLSLRLLSSSLIYLEDLDTLAHLDKSNQQGEQEKAPSLFWGAFLDELDKLLAQPGFVLLAATSKAADLPPALLASTRLGHGLVIDVPAISGENEHQPVHAPLERKARRFPAVVPRKRCPTCRQPLQDHWRHCVYCGSSLSAHCPHCGSPIPDIPGARFCFQCGCQLQ